MHEKMMNAKSQVGRSKLMHEHMSAMQGGMALMGDMSGAGMSEMPAMAGSMDAQHELIAKMIQCRQLQSSKATL